jgi:hypothetical protein
MPQVCCQAFLMTAILAGVVAAKEATVHTFDGEPEGGLPAGWAAAKTGDGVGSVWKIVATEAADQKGRALAQTSPEGGNAVFNLCVLKDERATDVDLSVRVKAISGVMDRGGGLVWRYRDANNYYVTRWNPLEDNFRVYYVVGGKRTQLATADIKLPPDAWHTVRAVQRGNHIQCYLDGNLLLDVMDESIKEPGAVGLWSKADAVTWFDDVSVGVLAKE